VLNTREKEEEKGSNTAKMQPGNMGVILQHLTDGKDLFIINVVPCDRHSRKHQAPKDGNECGNEHGKMGENGENGRNQCMALSFKYKRDRVLSPSNIGSWQEFLQRIISSQSYSLSWSDINASKTVEKEENMTWNGEGGKHSSFDSHFDATTLAN
jgi:hypothetical protein